MRIEIARPSNDSFDIQLAFAFSFLIFVGFGAVLALTRPPAAICLLNRFIDIPCPTCGATRVATALLHFDLISAFLWNPLVAVLTLCLFGFSVQVFIARSFNLSRLHLIATIDERRSLVRVLAFGLFFNWIYLLWAGI